MDIADPARPSPTSAVLDSPEELGDAGIRIYMEGFGCVDRAYAAVTTWHDGEPVS